jgi:thioredoxin reductase
MAKTAGPRVAVLGAGPIGLEAALYARRLDLPVTVYERSRIGEYVQRWGHLRLFTPFGMNATSLGRDAIHGDQPKHEFPADTDCVTGRQHVAAYLEPLAKSSLLRDCIRTETQVVQVGRQGLLKEERVGDPGRASSPFRLLLREAKGKERSEEADIILDCTGTYGRHRWLGESGIPAVGETAAEPQISYALDDILGERKNYYGGKTTLVVGGGYSAATSAGLLAELAQQFPETWVVWLARAANSQPLKRVANDPLKERDRLAVRGNSLATRGDANLEFHPSATVTGIENLGPDKGFRVDTRLAGKPRSWEVERIIGNVGYTPDTVLHRELQIHESYASLAPMGVAVGLIKQAGADCTAIVGQGPESLLTPEPGYFILGAKSYGRNSQFLLRTGFEQVRDVFKLIAHKSDLDLYKSQRRG